jgi:hypothetical protein
MTNKNPDLVNNLLMSDEALSISKTFATGQVKTLKDFMKSSPTARK